MPPNKPGLVRPSAPRFLEEQVAFVDHKESYTVARINGEAATNVGRDQLGGIRSTGDFGTLLGNTFDPNAGTDFRWDRWATLRSQRMYVFAFRVPQPKGYGLVESKRTLLVAYKGLLYADPQTGAVLRIELQCDIPKDSASSFFHSTIICSRARRRPPTRQGRS